VGPGSLGCRASGFTLGRQCQNSTVLLLGYCFKLGKPGKPGNPGKLGKPGGAGTPDFGGLCPGGGGTLGKWYRVDLYRSTKW